MKKIFLLFLFVKSFNVFSQPSISPSLTNEYYPDVEYTFTATITKSFSSITGEGGCYVTQQPSTPVGTTFTFKGKFADLNQKQTFKVFHPDNTFTLFEFKRIKSLFYGACTILAPNVSSVSPTRCQSVNIPISFSNLQWKTQFETPALCFGSITTYEYQLPVNWSLNSQTSTGSNWISGDNNETIITDGASGNNG